jgi:Uma2 family endonuclease
MSFAASSSSFLPSEWTLADMQRHLGDIPWDRIRAVPPPGTATEQDVVEAKDRYGRICELWDGVLVEKPIGSYESVVAAAIIVRMGAFVEAHNLGRVLAPDGIVRMLPGQIRAADVAFASWVRIAGQDLAHRRVWTVTPDLVVEVLSPSNTKREMDLKLRDYFQAGVRLAWIIDPEQETAAVYHSEHDATPFAAGGTLDGEEVLPGFSLSLAELFEKVRARKG